MVKTLVRLLYLLNGALFLAAGVSILLLGTNLLPAPIREFIVDEAEGNSHTLHLLQEGACLLVLAGVMLLWFARHYDQSRVCHWALTLFWGLIAWVHWFDTAGQFHTGAGQIVLTIPFAVLVVVGWSRG